MHKLQVRLIRKKIREKEKRKLQIQGNSGANPTGIQKMKREYYEPLLLINSKTQFERTNFNPHAKRIRVKKKYMNRKFI